MYRKVREIVFIKISNKLYKRLLIIQTIKSFLNWISFKFLKKTNCTINHSLKCMNNIWKSAVTTLTTIKRVETVSMFWDNGKTTRKRVWLCLIWSNNFQHLPKFIKKTFYWKVKSKRVEFAMKAWSSLESRSLQLEK